MTTTQQLRDLGQSIWLDSISRPLLDSGGLRHYIDDFSVTGLTSNPTIFDHAIGNTEAYDDSIRDKARAGKRGEALFMELALEDLRRAADLFRPAYDATDGVDGWVSMEISPLLANDAARSIDARLGSTSRPSGRTCSSRFRARRQGLRRSRQSIFAGIPINVTLLFSREQYVAAAEAYLRGIERRIPAGLDPRVVSVASLFVSRWDKAVSDTVPGSSATGSALRSVHVSIAPIASSWHRRAGAGSRPWVHDRNAWSGPDRHEGSQGVGHAVRRSVGRARHDQHHT